MRTKPPGGVKTLSVNYGGNKFIIDELLRGNDVQFEDYGSVSSQGFSTHYANIKAKVERRQKSL